MSAPDLGTRGVCVDLDTLIQDLPWRRRRRTAILIPASAKLEPAWLKLRVPHQPAHTLSFRYSVIVPAAASSPLNTRVVQRGRNQEAAVRVLGNDVGARSAIVGKGGAQQDNYERKLSPVVRNSWLGRSVALAMSRGVAEARRCPNVGHRYHGGEGALQCLTACKKSCAALFRAVPVWCAGAFPAVLGHGRQVWRFRLVSGCN